MNIEFGSYLWGIETAPCPASLIAILVFGSYLWGIETNNRRSAWWSRQSLDLTYEGLKHQRSCEIRKKRGSLDLTYEGLKLKPTHVFFSNHVGLDLTYEGLKLEKIEAAKTKEEIVWILPMRDWNTKEEVREMWESFKFGSYLWGIETVSP